MKLKALLISLLISAITFSQTEKDSIQNKDYGMGGPNQVENQIAEDEAPKASVLELGFISPYFDFKKSLKTKSGFDFALDYSSVYFGASEALPNNDNHTAAGMVRLYGSWEFVNRGKKNNGALIYKVEHRHPYTEVSPKNFGFGLGYVGLEVPPFNDDGFRMTNFYWRQRLADGRISFVVGLLDATDYVDVYAYASPWTGFMNFQFSTGSQTIYIPNDAALGVALAAYITDNIYAIGSISDAGSDPTDPFKNFDSFFTNQDYFKSFELGYVTSKERFFLDNIHLTYWHSDGSDVTASLPGWGIAFSATHHFDNNLHPFIRGGYAEDGGTLLQKSVVAGLAYQNKTGKGLLGASIGWGEINETTWLPGLKDQITTEVFYRLQLSTRFVVTPDVQYLINPALNPKTSAIFVAGLRARLAI